MAVSNIKNNTALVIRFEKGENKDGSPKVVSQKFSNISPSANDESIHAIGEAIGGILISGPMEIKKIEDYTLTSSEE